MANKVRAGFHLFLDELKSGCYKRVGALIGPTVLNQLLEPLKTALIESVAEGFIENNGITSQMTLILVAKLFTESLTVTREREQEEIKAK